MARGKRASDSPAKSSRSVRPRLEVLSSLDVQGVAEPSTRKPSRGASCGGTSTPNGCARLRQVGDSTSSDQATNNFKTQGYRRVSGVPRTKTSLPRSTHSNIENRYIKATDEILVTSRDRREGGSSKKAAHGCRVQDLPTTSNADIEKSTTDCGERDQTNIELVFDDVSKEQAALLRPTTEVPRPPSESDDAGVDELHTNKTTETDCSDLESLFGSDVVTKTYSSSIAEIERRKSTAEVACQTSKSTICPPSIRNSILAHLPIDIFTEHMMTNFDTTGSDLCFLRNVVRRVSRSDRAAMSRYVFKDVFLNFDFKNERHSTIIRKDLKHVVGLINDNAECLSVHYTKECRATKSFVDVFEAINLPTDGANVKMDLAFTRGSVLDGPTIKATARALERNVGIRKIWLPGCFKTVTDEHTTSEDHNYHTSKRIKDREHLSSYFWGYVKVITSQGMQREVHFGTNTPRSCLLAATCPHDKPARINILQISGNDRLTLMKLREQLTRMGQVHLKATVDELIIRDMPFIRFQDTAIEVGKLEKLTILNCLGAPKGFQKLS